MKMATCTRAVLLIAVVVLVSGTTRGQDAKPDESRQGEQGPDLATTIAFLNTSVRQEESYITSVNRCEVSVARNRRYTFAIPISSYVKSTDAYGVQHHGLKWLFVEESQVLRFNFGTLDLASIKSSPLPSPEFIKTHDLDENPSDRKNTDLTVVFFSSRDLTKTIEAGHFERTPDGNYLKAVFDPPSGMGQIVFESKDRAERFVTAMVHAVELCGGKQSDFAPTPSKP